MSSNLTSKIRRMKETIDEQNNMLENFIRKEGDMRTDLVATYVRAVAYTRVWTEDVSEITEIEYPSVRAEDVKKMTNQNMFKNMASVIDALMAALKESAEEYKAILGEVDGLVDASLEKFRTLKNAESRSAKGQDVSGNSTTPRPAERPQTPPIALGSGARVDSPLASHQDLDDPSDKDKSSRKNRSGQKKTATGTLGNLLGAATGSTTKKTAT